MSLPMPDLRRGGGRPRDRGARAVLAASLMAASLLAGCGGSEGDAVAQPPHQPLAAPPPCPAPGPGDGAGANLPDLTLSCLGQATSLGLRGLPRKPVVLNLWASWCGPCREEAPVLQRVHRAAGDGVLFLGIATRDDEGSARSFMQDFGMRYPSLYDRAGTALSQLAAPGLPLTIVLAADGAVLDRKVGGIGQDELAGALERAGVRLDRAVLNQAGGR